MNAIIKPLDDLPYDEEVCFLYMDGTVITDFWYDESKEDYINKLEAFVPVKGWFRGSDLLK